MTKNQLRIGLSALLTSIFAAVPFTIGQQSREAVAQETTSQKVAVADVVRNHTHAIALRAGNIPVLSSIAGGAGFVALNSSSDYDQGTATGAVHSHTVRLTQNDLQRIQAGQQISIQSEIAAGHTHQFSFTDPCNAAGTVPSPMPSITPTPTSTSCLPGDMNCWCQLYPNDPSCTSGCMPGDRVCWCQHFPSDPICQ